MVDPIETSDFKRYEKVHNIYNTDEIDGILDGQVYAFEKLDGANASVWNNNGTFYIGSRNRVVGWFNDPKGIPTKMSWKDEFRGLPDYVLANEELQRFLRDHPRLRPYGEWLVKHSIIYPSKHLNKLYIFDVEDRRTGYMLPYWEYEPLFGDYDINYLKPIYINSFPDLEKLKELVGHTDYEATPRGEGIVIKNYDFINKYSRKPYAKIVAKEFREMNAKVFGGPIPKEAVEMKIASDHCTLERVTKILEKIKDKKNGQEATIKDMGQLLGRMYHDIITEDLWQTLKRHKNPTIDFKKLQREITSLAKNHFMGILEARIK